VCPIPGGVPEAPAAGADEPTVIHVSTDAPFDVPGCGAAGFACATIQYAIGQAQPGDTVQVDRGDFTGPVTVDKAITLTADPSNSSIAGVITVASTAGAATVSNLNLVGDAGIAVGQNSGPTTITDNNFDVSGGTAAIALDAGPLADMPVTLSGNTGTVAAPMRTITVNGAVSVTGTGNQLTPTPEYTVTASPVTIVPGDAGHQFATLTTPPGASTLSNAQYDIAIISTGVIHSAALELSYPGGSGPVAVALSPSTDSAGPITGTVPSGATELTIGADSPPGDASLKVKVSLDEYDTAGTLINQVATGSSTVQVVVDHAPTATAATLATTCNAAAQSIQLQGSDPDGSALTYAPASDPSHGTVTMTGAGAATYQPRNGYVGADSFTFTVSDGRNVSAPATVSITVGPAPTRITKVAIPAGVTTAQLPTITVSVSSAAPVADGIVEISTGDVSGAAPVSRGKAIIQLWHLPGGSHRLAVTFWGTRTAEAVWGQSRSFQVAKAATSLGYTTNPLQLTTKTTRAVATITIRSRPFRVQGGRVTISNYDTGRFIVSGVPRNGVVKVRLPRFSIGQHNLYVLFSGTPYVQPAAVEAIERVAPG
jgi:hypothetical protein